jgi:hypothetical protein
VGKICTILQETFVTDLALPYYEIQAHVEKKSFPTLLCQGMGLTRTFCDYMSQFYALWFAVSIKLIVKDPIHKLQKVICFFHVITLCLAGALTGVLSLFNTFGV